MPQVVKRQYVSRGGQWVEVGSGGDGLDQATADGLYVNSAGDTMTGPLTLSADPVSNSQAATKRYADRFLKMSGGTMTGPLTLAAEPVAAMDPVNSGWFTNSHARGSFPSTAVASAVVVNLTWTGTVVGDGATLSGSTWTIQREGFWILSMWGKFSVAVVSGKRMFGSWDINSATKNIRGQVGVGSLDTSATGVVYMYAGDTAKATAYQNSAASMTFSGAGSIKWIGK